MRDSLLQFFTSIPNEIWLYTATVEFLLICLLAMYILVIRKKAKLSKFEKDIRKAKSAEVNMNDLMLSINKSKELYKELSLKCHPDKHINNELHGEIEDLFQEITKNKRNFQELIRLKGIAMDKFGIRID